MCLYSIKDLDPSCPSADCVDVNEQCGGHGWRNTTSPISAQCCEEGTSCYVKNKEYAQVRCHVHSSAMQHGYSFGAMHMIVNEANLLRRESVPTCACRVACRQDCV